MYDDQSPLVIAGKLKHRQRVFPSVSKNSIYRYIRSVYGRWIEYHRKQLRKKRRRHQPRTKPWKNRVLIDQRPGKINARREIGHAEGDFIVSGRSGRGVLLVVADRKLRVTFLEQILKPSQAKVTAGLLHIKQRYPEWKSVTLDNDILFRHHQILERRLGIKIYFCFPYHAWEKGQVENTNRWIRRYIPKGSNISKYSKRFIQKLEDKLNRRIMAVLEYMTPAEMLTRYLKRKQRRSAEKNS